MLSQEEEEETTANDLSTTYETVKTYMKASFRVKWTKKPPEPLEKYSYLNFQGKIRSTETIKYFTERLQENRDYPKMNKEQPIADFVRYTPNNAYFSDICKRDTSPGGLRDYRPHVTENVQAVGIGDASVEQTLDIGYVFRAAPGATFERPRGLIPGEIGWGIPWLVDLGTPKLGQQIPLGNTSISGYKITPGK